MFAFALAFLVCQAVLVVVWVDVPNLSENALVAIDPDSPDASRLREMIGRDIVDSRIVWLALAVMGIIWPVVIAESVFHWVTRPWDEAMRRYHFFGLLFCLCPSLRLCARSPEMGMRMWLPGLGWRLANRRLRDRLERHFSIPMIAIALLIMPVLIVEFFMKAQVAQHAWLRLLLHVGTGVIWFAFAIEFILMVSVAERKLQYCKKHWIDLAIIMLPLFSFLRSWQLLRATRLAKVMRIQQLTKIARVYRLRGTAVRLLRALVLLDLFRRITRASPERAIKKLRRRLDELEAEAKTVRRQIMRLEQSEKSESRQSESRPPESQPPESQRSESRPPESTPPETSTDQEVISER